MNFSCESWKYLFIVYQFASSFTVHVSKIIIDIGIFLGLHKTSNYIWQWLILEENFSNVLLLPHIPVPVLETPQSVSFFLIPRPTYFLQSYETQGHVTMTSAIFHQDVFPMSALSLPENTSHFNCPSKLLKGSLLDNQKETNKTP